jgi:hypothetical protein
MPTCPYHLNGFEHADLDLDGAEEGFDLGVKFEKRDARQPLWVFYISYHSTYAGAVSRGTVHFARDSSADIDELEQAQLLAAAKPFIADALRAIKAGARLESRSDAPQYV